MEYLETCERSVQRQSCFATKTLIRSCGVWQIFPQFNLWLHDVKRSVPGYLSSSSRTGSFYLYFNPLIQRKRPKQNGLKQIAAPSHRWM